MEVHGLAVIESDGGRMVWSGNGPGVCSVIRLLVYGLSGGAAGDGGEIHVGSTPDAADCGSSKDAISISGDPAGNDCDCPHVQIGK